MEIEPSSSPLDDFMSADIAILTDLDKPMLRRYMTLLNEWQRLRDIREREGLFTDGPNGQLAPHPVVKMLNDNESRLLAMEDRLGLNPASRLKLSADKTRQKKDELSLGALLDEIEE